MEDILFYIRIIWWYHLKERYDSYHDRIYWSDNLLLPWFFIFSILFETRWKINRNSWHPLRYEQRGKITEGNSKKSDNTLSSEHDAWRIRLLNLASLSIFHISVLLQFCLNSYSHLSVKHIFFLLRLQSMACQSWCLLLFFHAQGVDFVIRTLAFLFLWYLCINYWII